MRLCSSASQRAKQRGLEVTLSYVDILDMLAGQDGKCAYSGVSMEAEQPNSHWRMSLERVENSKGYTSSNCVLVAAEFNSSDYSRARNVNPECIVGTAQWSLHKVQTVPRLQKQLVDMNQLYFDIELAKRPRTPQSHALSMTQCSICLSVLPRQAFSRRIFSASGLSPFCKDCATHSQQQIQQVNYVKSYYTSLRGHLARCLGHARERAKSKKQHCSITLNHLVDMLAQQGGRCFYSHVPLNYGQAHTDWRLSIERLDNSIGYTPSNTVLIAVEFNTPDNSRNCAITEVFGTAQWSREKVWHVWGPYSKS